jgi:GNAT superfamily N-acetyltransferase
VALRTLEAKRPLQGRDTGRSDLSSDPNARPPEMRRASGKWLRWLRTVAHMLHRGSVRSLLLRSLSVVSSELGLDRYYVRVLLFQRDITRSAPAIRADIPLELRDLAEDEIAGYCRQRTDPDEAEVRRRLADGYRCLVSWSDGRIIGEIWLGYGELWLGKLERRIRLSPDDVYVYHSFVIPELRGRNVGTARARLLGEHLRKEGSRRLVYTVAPHNRPGLGTPAKLGAECLGSVGYLRVGPFQRDFARLRGRRLEWTRRAEPAPTALRLPAA